MTSSSTSQRRQRPLSRLTDPFSINAFNTSSTKNGLPSVSRCTACANSPLTSSPSSASSCASVSDSLKRRSTMRVTSRSRFQSTSAFASGCVRSSSVSQHARVTQLSQQVAQQPERAVIGPVQIVSVEQQRLPLRDVREHFRYGVEEQQPFFVWRELWVFGKRTKTLNEFGRELRELRRCVAEQFVQFVVVFFFARPTTKCFDKRQVRRGRFVLVTTARQDERAVNGGLDRDLARQPRLAGAGFAAEQHGVSVSFARTLPELARFAELVGAANQMTARECFENRNRGRCFRRDAITVARQTLVQRRSCFAG